MNKLLICLVLLLGGFTTKAQQDSLPPYLKVPYIPPFKLLQTDSTWYTKDSLPRKRPVVVMYFSPDCGHCQLQVKAMTDSMHLIEKAFFVFASYKSLDEIEEFEDTYHLKNFKNIRTGRDTKYFIPSFYRVKFTPFIAVYDAKGNYKNAFEMGASVAELKQWIDQ